MTKIIYLIILSTFLNSCIETNNKSNSLDAKAIISEFSKSLEISSPTRSYSLQITSILYKKGLNDTNEKEIVNIFKKIKKKNQTSQLIKELKYKGEKQTILNELFYRWNRKLDGKIWKRRDKNKNTTYLLSLLTPILSSTHINKKQTTSIFNALNKRYSKDGSYTIYSQNLITSATLKIGITKLNPEIQDIIKEALREHLGKISSNGQINKLREELNISIYK